MHNKWLQLSVNVDGCMHACVHKTQSKIRKNEKKIANVERMQQNFLMQHQCYKECF